MRGARVVLAMVVWLVVFASPAVAKGHALAFDRYATNPQSPVEQQTPGWYGVDCPPGPGACQPDEAMWVVNPTENCAWDIDDLIKESAWGGYVLRPGESVAFSECLIADNAYHVAGMYVTPGLVTTVRYEPFGLEVTVDPAFGKACVIGPVGFEPGELPPVEGSNGGVGIFTTVTVTVRNASSKTVRNIEGEFELWSATTSAVGRLCPYPPAQASFAGASWKIAQ